MGGYGLNLAARIEIIESLFCEIVKFNYEKKEQIINVALVSRVKTGGIKVPVFEAATNLHASTPGLSERPLTASVINLSSSVGSISPAGGTTIGGGGGSGVVERYVLNDPLCIKPIGILIKTANDLDPLNLNIGLGCSVFQSFICLVFSLSFTDVLLNFRVAENPLLLFDVSLIECEGTSKVH
eukprot:TRINITY_DN16478_c0_g1_i1.p2 TRINITY_DN16478_c0_g1~~TRINITY_DN16478_c0_g1_i1.p2  ORF type:complete len:183 (+),score=4.09 TRINITY_DN16478_c0_g1_i1:3-551(+)